MNPNTSETGLPPGRRRLLYAGVAGAAAVAGAGLAWWKWRPDESSKDAAAVIWPLSFDTPTGSTLKMHALRGKPLLLNFWATWCPPCIDELPLLEEF